MEGKLVDIRELSAFTTGAAGAIGTASANKVVKPDPDTPVKPNVGTATEDDEHVLLNEKPHHADEPSLGGVYGGATIASVSGTEPAKGTGANAQGILSKAASLARELWWLWLALALIMAMDKK